MATEPEKVNPLTPAELRLRDAAERLLKSAYILGNADVPGRLAYKSVYKGTGFRRVDDESLLARYVLSLLNEPTSQDLLATVVNCFSCGGKIMWFQDDSGICPGCEKRRNRDGH